MKNIICLLCATLLFVACKKNDDGYLRTETMYVASEKRMAYGPFYRSVFVVKNKMDEKWTFLYDIIENFDWEQGYEYELLVKFYKIDNPMEDQASERCVLDKIVLKTKKNSVGLPNDVESSSHQ